MRRYIEIRMLLAVLLVLAPLGALADTTFFSDNFSNGSTLNSAAVSPTTNSASYTYASGKSPNPDPPTIAPSDLQFGIASTSSGAVEIQALFSTNGVVLTKMGDYVQVAVVFTNSAGILTGNGLVGLGLYNSHGSAPVADGGLLNNMTSSSADHVTDGTAGWQGYVGQMGYSGLQNNRIMTRDAQTGSGNNNQDLVCSGSSSQSYHDPSGSTIGSSVASTVSLTVGQAYTDVVSYTLVGTNSSGFPNSVAITNTLYDSANTVLAQVGAVATNSDFSTVAFDGVAFGWIERGSEATMADVASITISGSVTVDTNPPSIITQPVSATAPTNTMVPFQVAATGLNDSYQWKRYGTNLVDGGSISGAKTPTLIVSPTTSADYASGANGYYCTVANVNGSVDSATVSLTQVTAKDLVWSGSGNSWDLNSNNDWVIKGTSTAATFNYGDKVTFDDTGISQYAVYMDSPYLSASTVTVSMPNFSDVYVFANTRGSIAGPGSMKVIGAGELEIANANTYSGGTLISNATALVKLDNLGGLGTGPITLAKAGGMMEVVPNANASSGIEGDIVVNDDFTVVFDGYGSYAGSFRGNLSGPAGKTLTLQPGLTTTTNRYRVYGADMTYDGNLVLAGPSVANADLSGTALAPYNSSGSQTYNGVISGNGGIVQRGTLAILNGQNTYSGGTTPTTGTIGIGANSSGNPVTSGPIGTGPLYLYVEGHATGSGGIEAYGGAHTIANSIEYPTADNNLTLIIGGSNDLTLAGPYTLNGNDGTSTYTNRIIEVNNTALTTISGVISDGGQGFGLEKTGTGTLALDNTETYTGTTTVSNGLLGGTGTIVGPVIATSGGIAPGDNGIGTLTINNSLTLGSSSSNVFEVNKTAGTHDLLNVSGAVAYGGTLYAANLSGTLTTNDSFTIVSAGSETGDFAAIAGSPGPGLTWSFDPTNGVLSVVGSGVATNPTNIVVTVTSGTPPTVNLSWPLDHKGWTLQTNSVGLASATNWFDYPGSTSVTNVSIPVDQTQPNVFYRLMYIP